MQSVDVQLANPTWPFLYATLNFRKDSNSPRVLKASLPSNPIIASRAY